MRATYGDIDSRNGGKSLLRIEFLSSLFLLQKVNESPISLIIPRKIDFSEGADNKLLNDIAMTLKPIRHAIQQREEANCGRAMRFSKRQLTRTGMHGNA
jgi:hypothetical protein